MTDVTTADADDSSKNSKMPLFIGIFLGILGAGGGFFLTSNDVFAFPESAKPVASSPLEAELNSVAFVPLDPLTISLASPSTAKHLRFRAELEVSSASASQVEKIKPRIVDVINTYLRASEVQDIMDPTALMRLQAQMLRRVQAVSGPNMVSDLLIMEFVVN